MLRLALIGAALLVFSSLLDVPNSPSYPALTAIITALAATLALLLFRPSDTSTTFESLGWCAITSLLAGNWLLLNPATRPLWPAIPNLLLGTFFFSALCMFAARRIGTPLVIALFVVLTLAPVWAAPIAELAGNPPWLTNLIVAISPASMFAVALDLDLMRTSWFYEHSAIGSLRYSYIPWAAYIATMAVLAIAAASRSRLIQRRTRV